MKFSKFQLIVLVIFILFIVIGVATFATYRGSNTSVSLPPITIWGTFPGDVFTNYISEINSNLAEPISVGYVEKDPNSFSQEFISALARGQGPDAILIPADMILPHLDKVIPIPYTALPERDFLDIYIQEGEMYLTQDGILAVPLTVDPLVMYWNRDIFSSAGLATYPRYWDEFSGLVKQVGIKDQNGNIRKSAVAMGDFTNIANAREILGTLLLQKGNPVTMRDSQGNLVSTLTGIGNIDPITVVDFFSHFADPSSDDYSWNRALPGSKAAFLSGTLATYFGFASELKDIRSRNPNLNFDVAPIPQLRKDGIKSVYGRMYGLSIVRSSPNPNNTYQIFSLITNPQSLPWLSQTLYVPSVRRDVIAGGSSDPYISVFNQAALVARSWLDADPLDSYAVFGNMIQSVTNGSKTAYEALHDAKDEYDAILRRAGE